MKLGIIKKFGRFGRGVGIVCKKVCKGVCKKIITKFFAKDDFVKEFGDKTQADTFDLPPSIIKTLRKKRLKTKLFRLVAISSISFCFVVLAGLFLLNIKSAYKGLMISTIVIPIENTFDKNSDKNQTIESFFVGFTVAKVENIIHSAIAKGKAEEISAKTIKQITSIVSSFYKDKNIGDFIKCNKKNQCFLTIATSEEFDRYYKEVFLYNQSGLKSNAVYNLIIASFEIRQYIKLSFNRWFFTNADSRYGELAGILASLKGTLYIIAIFLCFCVPLAIVTALYLEEFAKKNWMTNLIELNINNLAAVPSIIYGLLGLLVYVNYMSLPRSSAIVGGLTLSLLVMPVLITSARNSIKSIPQMLREITFAMGASKSHVVFGVVFPAALPGIFTGIILTLARLIGETAPLLLIGMVAFVGKAPSSIYQPATAIPVQIYLWSSSPNYLLINKASLLILFLMFFLLITNFVINIVRQKFEITQN